MNNYASSLVFNYSYRPHTFKMQESPAGNRKRRTVRGITFPTISYPRRGNLPWPGGIPTLAGGYLPWLGVPSLAGVPTLAVHPDSLSFCFRSEPLFEISYTARGRKAKRPNSAHPPWPGWGVPTLARMEYPPPPNVNRHL